MRKTHCLTNKGEDMQKTFSVRLLMVAVLAVLVAQPIDATRSRRGGGKGAARSGEATGGAGAAEDSGGSNDGTADDSGSSSDGGSGAASPVAAAAPPSSPSASSAAAAASTAALPAPLAAGAQEDGDGGGSGSAGAGRDELGVAPPPPVAAVEARAAAAEAAAAAAQARVEAAEAAQAAGEERVFAQIKEYQTELCGDGTTLGLRVLHKKAEAAIEQVTKERNAIVAGLTDIAARAPRADGAAGDAPSVDHTNVAQKVQVAVRLVDAQIAAIDGFVPANGEQDQRTLEARVRDLAVQAESDKQAADTLWQLKKSFVPGDKQDDRVTIAAVDVGKEIMEMSRSKAALQAQLEHANPAQAEQLSADLAGVQAELAELRTLSAQAGTKYRDAARRAAEQLTAAQEDAAHARSWRGLAANPQVQGVALVVAYVKGGAPALQSAAKHLEKDSVARTALELLGLRGKAWNKAAGRAMVVTVDGAAATTRFFGNLMPGSGEADGAAPAAQQEVEA